MKGYGTKPKTPADKQLSIRHVKETMELELRKAKEHRTLKTKQEKNGYKDVHNTSHYKHHMDDVKERQKYLKKLRKTKVKELKK